MPRPKTDRNSARQGRSIRGHAAASEARATVEENAAERRSQVFRNDVPHAPQENSSRSHALTLAELLRIKELYAQGMSQLNVAVELGVALVTVQNAIKKNSFVKGAAGGVQP